MVPLFALTHPASRHGREEMNDTERSLLHVCLAPADEAWVRGYLLPALNLGEDQVHTRREDRPGQPVVTEIAEATTRCRFTLLVLSQAFLADEWSAYAAFLASHQAIRQWRLLLVAREKCELPLHLDFRVRVDFFDGESWEEPVARLREVLGQRPPLEDDDDIPCPYPGLAPFEAEENALFFGREDEIEDLYSRLTRPEGERGCQIFVIGPSGSGKSSLLGAGLLPRLARDQGDRRKPQFMVCRLRPGERPMEALAGALRHADSKTLGEAVAALLEGRSPAARVLLVIDPLEEIFTLASDVEAEAFLSAVRELRDQPRCAVVALMRADFYPQLMTSSLWPVSEERRFDLGPLRNDALREAIRRPGLASEVGKVYVEPLLLERLAHEADHGVGVLPLLQETLVLLWKRRRERGEHRLLTLASYESLSRPGGTGPATSSALMVALSRHADSVIADLPDGGESLARRILLRLVHLGEGVPDTRRQQPESALRAAGDDRDTLEEVLDRLARSRLVTLVAAPVTGSERLVDLSHDALISGWPKLSGWLRDLREHEQKRRRLEDRAREWLRLGGGRGALLDREQLPQFEAWIASDTVHRLGVDSHLKGFVAASRAALRWRRRWLYASGFTLLTLTTAVSVLALFLIRQRAMTKRGITAVRDAIEMKRIVSPAGTQPPAPPAPPVQQAVNTLRNSAGRDPRNTEFHRYVAGYYNRLGDAQAAKRNLSDALRSYHQAVDVLQDLARRQPENTELQVALADAYSKLGDVHTANNELSEAVLCFEYAAVVLGKLARRNPDNASLQSALAVSYDKLANAYAAMGKHSYALGSHRAALRINKKAAKRHPNILSLQTELAASYNKLASAYAAMGKRSAALRSHRAARRINKKVAERNADTRSGNGPPRSPTMGGQAHTRTSPSSPKSAAPSTTSKEGLPSAALKGADAPKTRQQEELAAERHAEEARRRAEIRQQKKLDAERHAEEARRRAEIRQQKKLAAERHAEEARRRAEIRQQKKLDAERHAEEARRRAEIRQQKKLDAERRAEEARRGTKADKGEK
jgi:tetratricopeptide (TPR) repeat protein